MNHTQLQLQTKMRNNLIVQVMTKTVNSIV